MNKYRWAILVVNLLVILAIIGLGFYFFGGLGLIMQRVLGVSEDYAPDLYFKDSPIPTLDPNAYKPQKPTETKLRSLEKHYAYIGRAYTPEPDKPEGEMETEVKPPAAQVLLNSRVKQVFSVVYASPKSKMNGCYLQTPVKDVGDRIYYFGIGDQLPDLGDNVVFTIDRVEEIEKGKKYKVVFRDGMDREAFKEFVRSDPPAYDIKTMIKK
ncbi:MAG: hypothetical protein ACYS8W_15625 [Planctomycetota bacterium]|jgi:hypothetical protein